MVAHDLAAMQTCCRTKDEMDVLGERTLIQGALTRSGHCTSDVRKLHAATEAATTEYEFCALRILSAHALANEGWVRSRAFRKRLALFEGGA